jgi:MFS family permease
MSSVGPDRSRSLWRHRDFMKLWTGETISQLGTQVTLLALPLTAILILKASAFQVGLLATVEFLPFILVGLPAGVWFDRLPRRPVLIAGDVGRFLALGSIPVAYELGVLHIAQLLIVAFVSGICTVFFDVAYQAYLPSMVDRDQLVDGNAKLEISRSGAQLAGPGMAGLLIEAVKAPVAIAADAISYLFSAVFVGWIRQKEPDVERAAPDGTRPKMRTQIAEGLRYVLGNRYLKPIAACTATSNLFSAIAFPVLLLYAVRRLGMSAGTIGLVFTISNVGILGGAFIARRIADRVGLGPAIVGSAFLFSVSWFLLPLATRPIAFPMLVGALLIGGFGSVVYNINQVSFRQAITPNRIQGRMNATMRFMVWGTMPIGSFLGGILGSHLGLRPTLWVAAIGGSVAFIPPLLSPVRSLERMPEQVDEEPAPASARLDATLTGAEDSSAHGKALPGPGVGLRHLDEDFEPAIDREIDREARIP